MRIEVHHRCSDFDSYRAARVKSLFNCESGCNFDLVAELPIENLNWQIGLVVGPSGSGKTSIGRQLFGADAVYRPVGWPRGKPIIDAIGPGRPFDDVAAALCAVGLGSVPAWLRPYPVLSTGEKFRADLARIMCRRPSRVVVDEFTSVVDRQTARIGALAFGRAWRRTEGQCVLLSCHRDILGWLGPDWIFDTATGRWSGRGLWRRPRIELLIYRTNWRHWPLFMPHHYLKVGPAPCSVNYVGLVDGKLVSHMAVTTMVAGRRLACRGCRLVVMPEWQGIGIGTGFLNRIAAMMRAGSNRWRRRLSMYFHTSHPGLCRSLRRSGLWRQVSCRLYGDNKQRAAASLRKSAIARGSSRVSSGYGGHFRAIQGFVYEGPP